MQAAEAIASTPVPSPCNSICTMNAASGLCEGCQRTLDEIGAWGRASDEDKRRIWRAIAERQEQLFG